MKAPFSASSGAPAITTFLPDSHKRIHSSPKLRRGHSLTIQRAPGTTTTYSSSTP